jgi:DNA repair exonuclease SbcCD ATPase subunit
VHVSLLRFSNWKCFAGEQEVRLKPLAYSVVARRVGEEERSNWGGKTTFLRGVHFLLFGEHGEATEDGWITRGEDAGEVAGQLSDGSRQLFVQRQRRRGKSTQLLVRELPDGPPMKGDEAQRFLDGLVGMGREDFQATCYFEQRQMARLVLARPQERMDVIAAWMRLGQLVEGEELVRKELGDASYALLTERSRLQDEERKIANLLGERDRTQLVGESGLADVGLLRARDEYEEALQRAEAGRLAAGTRVRVESYERIAREGRELAERLKGMDLEQLARAEQQIEGLVRAAAADLGSAKQEATERRRVALGQFDGRCPVAGVTCPVKDDINNQGVRSRKALEVAAQNVAREEGAYNEVVARLTPAKAAHQEALRLKARIDTLREQIEPFHREYRRAREQTPVDMEALNREVSGCLQRVSEAERVVGALQRGLAELDRALAERERLRGVVAGMEAACATHREAALVFGKQGAQRRVAELALRGIEDGANAMLRECGIDLSVEVRWSREGQGLAKACDACGSPFPASARVKRCERCGAERGQLTVNRLELDLSDRSGAAEDLAGAAIQLSASAWLRGERASGWGTALLDEPFGQLDAANRRAFATHLAAMLRGRYGFEQALVVSHTADTTHMLPGRIEITNDGGRATVRVA